MADERTRHVWTYAGRRFGSKLYHAWQDHDGEERLFAGRNLSRFAPIGGRYTVKLKDRSVFTSGEDAPVYEGMVDDDQVRLDWSALDKAAAMADATVKQEKRDKDQDLIRETLSPLRRIIDRRRGPLDKGAFINAVTAEMWRPLTKSEREGGTS
jgi:hypothetical protein